MNNHPTKYKAKKATTHRKPNQPQRIKQPSLAEDFEYSPSHQVDPWRGNIMQIGWEYCV